jgi:hypothetical protein
MMSLQEKGSIFSAQNSLGPEKTSVPRAERFQLLNAALQTYLDERTIATPRSQSGRVCGWKRQISHRYACNMEHDVTATWNMEVLPEGGTVASCCIPISPRVFSVVRRLKLLLPDILKVLLP